MNKLFNTLASPAIILAAAIATACSGNVGRLPVTPSQSDLVADSLATRWDEAMPLGNATIGALVWRNDSSIRLSLDRTDLWDLRPTDSLSGDNFTFEWVKEHIRSGNYSPVQQKLDVPYNVLPAPSKIPGAALHLPLNMLGKPESVRLYLNDALLEVKWPDGAIFQTFVHAEEPVGWFSFTNIPDSIAASIIPTLITPVYSTPDSLNNSSRISAQDVRRLGYPQGTVNRTPNSITYHQPGYEDFSYDVAIEWQQLGNDVVGVWSLTTSLSPDEASANVSNALSRGIKSDFDDHRRFWWDYWNRSSVHLPDSVLQRQYDNEMYKFGSATRSDSYPISLQAVWTADDGHLPPWKGDYHHDLNTQLSYWPAYTGNHLSEGMGYLNTLWNQRDVYKKYTKQYFGTDGLNVPGVCTLTGEPMGGWIQYSLSPTIGAWLAQHFYLHWKYSADPRFLEEMGYPFVSDVARHIEQVGITDADGHLTLEFSSSPEINNNSLEAWFKTPTNFDLALMHFIFNAAAEMAEASGNTDEAKHWAEQAARIPEFDLDEDGALTFAKGYPYNTSHRHFSHALAIHPFGIIDWANGEKDQEIITATINKLRDFGPDYWTGYSYAWYANMLARAKRGDEAADALRIFSTCFCLPNTFHVNGDQSGTGKSQMTYRPFTLEGNFAAAAAIQEMLLQSHNGTVEVFPAIPSDWKDVSFDNLRAIGAFLVSATLADGVVTRLDVTSERGGDIRLVIPGRDDVVELSLEPGEHISVI